MIEYIEYVALGICGGWAAGGSLHGHVLTDEKSWGVLMDNYSLPKKFLIVAFYTGPIGLVTYSIMKTIALICIPFAKAGRALANLFWKKIGPY